MLDELVKTITRYTAAQPGESPYVTPVDGLTILRSDHEKPPAHMVLKPALCIVVQGAKWTTVGNTRHEYRAGEALIVSVEIPAVGRVTQASPTEPYLGLIIEFDLGIMREVMEGLNARPTAKGDVGQAICVTDFQGPLAECVLRMVRLLGTPQAIPTLQPTIAREISYWLLTGPHGGEIAKLTMATSHSQRIVAAIHSLRDRFTEAVRIEELAEMAQLSPSAFHRNFKALTSMTPLQYQKRLRLLEARRLIISAAANIEAAAFQVGYESPSQFSREYARMFGAPPRRDAIALRRVSS
ncbi:AraC family transcriptional regulator [Rhizobium sp. Root1220]|uniref:AraC family transcriptional regulator n=1 Tax=Rhizobium sp. Root1220 TaxID=1736432 RepID=UPI0006FF30E9|nr:AraC family transcriptional regulator [Rhizobium sp. Root1220]KQV70224.1 AraC family transcriptional regulator [Rhizobium sp. Root1220]